jgi:glycosyltransferase involved in cell wall biosynthesis
MRNNKEENFGKNKNDNINLNITEKNNTNDKEYPIPKEKQEEEEEEEEEEKPKEDPQKPKPAFQLDVFQKYVKVAREGKILYKKNLVKSENPKISVVIALYNAQKFIEPTLKSVQNQKMKDIEIIIVDDFSQDNSVELVEKAMKTDPRIMLFKNKKNMAVLYTKSIGVLKAKGKYIFILDDDDLLLVDDLFDTIYQEIEKIKFDIIEYSWIDSTSFGLEEQYINKKPYCNHPINTVLIQPKLRRRFSRTDQGSFILQDRYVWGRIIKTDIYVKCVNEIGEQDLTRRVIIHDDTIITFMLFKFAYSFKKIGKIGLVHFVFKESASAESQKYATPEKYYDTCISFLNYVELLYKHSENDPMSRQEVFWALNTWFIRSKCKDYEPTFERSLEVAKGLYKDPYLNRGDKMTIKYAYRAYIKD